MFHQVRQRLLDGLALRRAAPTPQLLNGRTTFARVISWPASLVARDVYFKLGSRAPNHHRARHVRVTHEPQYHVDITFEQVIRAGLEDLHRFA